MVLTKALLIGFGVAIIVLILTIAAELAATLLGFAAPFINAVETGSGGLGAWSAGFSESALGLAIVCGIIAFGLSYRRQLRKRTSTGS